LATKCWEVRDPVAMTFDGLHRVIMQGENARIEFKAEVSAEVARRQSVCRLSADLAQRWLR